MESKRITLEILQHAVITSAGSDNEEFINLMSNDLRHELYHGLRSLGNPLVFGAVCIIVGMEIERILKEKDASNNNR